MTGILYKHLGPAVAEGFFHGFSGWFIFMFALAILLLEMWILSGFRSIFGKKLATERTQTQKKENILAADTHGHHRQKKEIFSRTTLSGKNLLLLRR